MVASRHKPVLRAPERSAFSGTTLRQLLARNRRLSEAPALLDALLAPAPVGFAFLDCRLRYVWVNEKYAAMNGLPVSQHLDRPFRQVNPQLALKLEPILNRVLKSAEPVVRLELQAPKPARGRRTDRWWANYYAVGDPKKRILGIGIAVIEVV